MKVEPSAIPVKVYARLIDRNPMVWSIFGIGWKKKLIKHIQNNKSDYIYADEAIEDLKK